MSTVLKLKGCNRLASVFLKTCYASSAIRAKNFSTETNETIETETEDLKELEFNPNYTNKNPRNLEWSGHQYKRFGWNLQYPPKDFYHQYVYVYFSN